MILWIKDNSVVNAFINSTKPFSVSEVIIVAWVPEDTSLIYNEQGYIPDPRLIMSTEEVKLCRREDVDMKTDCIIDNGMIYQNIQFKLDVQHQLSYKGSYDLRQYITYPYLLKGVGENYLPVNDESEFSQFILTGFGFIQQVLHQGWTIKQSFETMTKEQLLEWVDPR
jgi:hypothetical protein